MGKLCLPLPKKTPSEEVSFLDSWKINTAQKVQIRRALRNHFPESKRLYKCIESNVTQFVNDPECRRHCNESDNESLHTCACTESSSEANSFCNLFRSKPRLDDKALCCFINIIQTRLDKELRKHEQICCERKFCTRCKNPQYLIVPVQVCSRDDSLKHQCSCEFLALTCAQTKLADGECKKRSIPIVLRHFGDDNENLCNEHKVMFKIDEIGKCQEIAKWGQFLDLIERLLHIRELSLKRFLSSQFIHDVFKLEASFIHQSRSCIGDVCSLKSPVDHFEDLDRFRDIQKLGMSRLHRKSMRWANCLSKRWSCVLKHVHLIIHIPSMSYSCHLRSVAEKNFRILQNIQIGRLGWLANHKSIVIYVCPGKSNEETKYIMENFVKLARPDISISRLWIIVNDEECLCNDVDEAYRSGCENMFYTPSVYRRVRHLSAGNNGFIIPGVLSKMDIFVACELRSSILSPPFSFQEHLLNKYNVMTLLSDARIRHPPFAGVRNFTELCQIMAEAITGPMALQERKWILKVNGGFSGNQSALFCLDDEMLHKTGLELLFYLAEKLPQKLKLSEGTYEDVGDFLKDINRYGGVVTACPPRQYRVVSLGCFLEHDTAEADLYVTADVIKSNWIEGCSLKNVGYIIPQTTLPYATLKELTVAIGKAILVEPYFGFFGVDLVVFDDDHCENKELTYWVVDVNPYYTDLISFEDWRKFCLEKPLCENTQNTSNLGLDHRYVVCSGKLYVDGLAYTSRDFFYELSRKLQVDYRAKAKSGCMICPIDFDKRAVVAFSIYRSKRTALQYFIRVLKGLHFASIKELDSIPRNKTYVLALAEEMEEFYGVSDKEYTHS